MVKHLLKHPEIEVNTLNINRETPLVIAAKHGYVDIINLIIESNTADINIRDAVR